MANNTPQLIFNRQQSAQIKGVAVVMLILHHLFLFPSANPWFTSIVGNSWGGIEFFLSSVGKLCISLFFFVSGYGIWHSSCDDNSLWRSTFRRLRHIYTVYGVTVLVTVLILYVWSGALPLHSWWDAVYTFLGIDVSLNGSWWFFIIYVELLVLTPPAVAFIQKYSWQLLLLLSCFLYLFSPQSGFQYFTHVLMETKPGVFLYNYFPINLFWLNQLYFFTGFCLAASGMFERALQQSVQRLNMPWLRLGTALLLLTAVLAFRYLLVDIGDALGVISRQGMDIVAYTMMSSRADFILGPMYIFGLALLFHGHRLPVLVFLGRHSAAIWLIHATVLYIVVSILGSYHLWSPLVFMIILFFCILYAQVYAFFERRWFA